MASGDIKGFLEIARDEFRHHADRLLGMGLFWAWLQIIFASSVCAPAEFLPISFQPLHQIWTLSLFFTILVFLAVLLNRSKIRGFTNNAILIASHVLMALGSAFLVSSFYGLATMLTTILGIVMIGIGSGLAFLLWGEHLSLLEPRRVLFDTAIFSFLTALLYILVIILPAPAIQGAVIIIPLISAALFKSSVTKTQTAKPSREVLESPGLLNQKGWLIGLAVLVGLIYGIMRGTSLSFTSSSLVEVTIATVIGIAIAGLLLTITTVFFKKESELNLVCQIAFPLLAGGFLLLPRFSTGLPLPLIVFTIGHSYFYFLLWVFCSSQSQRETRSAVVVFAIGLLAFLGSSLAGSIASDFMVVLGSESSQVITIISIIVVYLIILLLAYIMGKSRKTNDADNKKT
ncbi:MAG: hypothetical protein ACOYD7_01440 [Raoultibacter sp.]|jgi:hypothetical protein